MVKEMKIMVAHCPDPATGHGRLTPLPETAGHPRAHLGQSLVVSLLLSSVSQCAQGFVCVLHESFSSVLCKFWWLYGGVNGDLLQEGLCHAQVCCTQSPCACGRPLPTHTSAGDTETLKGRSGSVSVASYGVHKVLFEPSERLWQVCVLILNATLPLLLSCWVFGFVLGHGVSFWWDPAFSCQRLFAVSFNFGVLAEDEHISLLCHLGLDFFQVRVMPSPKVLRKELHAVTPVQQKSRKSVWLE